MCFPETTGEGHRRRATGLGIENENVKRREEDFPKRARFHGAQGQRHSLEEEP